MKFNKLIPELQVSNLKKSLYFYQNILKFKLEYGRIKFVFLSFQGSQIMLEEQNDNWKVGVLKYPYGRGINFQFEVKNLNAIILSLNKHKYKLFKLPKENKYRIKNKQIICREVLVKDPDGYLLRFSEVIK